MVILAVLAAVAAGVVAVRGWLRRYDALGRPRRFPSVSVALLAVIAVGLATPSYLRHREESRLTQVATKLVGSKAVVHCQSYGGQFFDANGDLGYVRWSPGGVPEHQTFIMHDPCIQLRHYLRSNKQRPTADQVVAVHVLTHESMHMRGVKNEAAAECAAVQRDAETAQLLGATAPEALALAKAYWTVDYPRMPDAYTSPDCKPGGALDEHLADAPWS